MRKVIAATVLSLSVCSVHAVTKCTDRKTVLYTQGDCPAGWLEIIGQVDVTKIPPRLSDKAAAEQNAKVERVVEDMERRARAAKDSK